MAGKLVKTLIGTGNDADVGFDGAEGLVCAFCASVRNSVTESGFAYVGQTDNTKFHISSSSIFKFC